jgi:hypothetical protein
VQAGLAEIRSKKSNTRVVYFESFFMHHEWLKQSRLNIRSLLEVKPTCCSRVPPPDAVVIHMHFSSGDRRVEKLQIQAGNTSDCWRNTSCVAMQFGSFVTTVVKRFRKFKTYCAYFLAHNLYIRQIPSIPCASYHMPRRSLPP